MKEIIAICIVAIIICGAITLSVIAKKKGHKCIGCPYKNGCKGSCNGDNKNA